MWKPAIEPLRGRPLFRALVEALASDVATGRLPAGVRLPPHRDLADDLGIARGTVARTYQEAERLGLVRSDVGRGTYVLAPDAGRRPYSSLLEPPTVQSDLSTNVPLAGIDPDPAGALRRIADRADRSSLFRYLPPTGLTRHRMAGVHWLGRLGVRAGVDDVLLCAGAQHALFVTLAHLGEKARALYVEELTYPGLHGIAEALGRPLVAVAMDDEGMVPASLERACRQHGPGVVYVMPTIHNPTGGVMSATRRRALAEVARSEGLFVVEDAANRMLAVDPPPPILAFAPERTFLAASVSKVLCPGLRVAFLVGPREELAAIARRVWATQWMVGPIGAEIVAMWLGEGVVDRTLARKRLEAVRRQRVARRALKGLSVTAHPHALHMWIALPAAWRSERFTAALAERGIVVTPSTAFWARRTPPPRAVRIALGGVRDAKELEVGLEQIARLVSEP